MPVGEVALALGCMLGKVFGILEVWIFCRLANCSFEAHRKSLLWPWPLVKEGIWNFGGVAAFAGWQTGAWQTAALKAHRKPLLWPGPGVPVGEGGVAAFAGWQTAALKAARSHCCRSGVPAGDGVWRV